MKRPIIYALVALLISCTVVQCNALRTRANTLRVQRVRRIDEALDE